MVAAFYLVGDGLADVVQQCSGLGDAYVGADVTSDHAGQVAPSHGVLEDVLSVAGAEFELTEQLDDLDGHADDAGFLEGLLPASLTVGRSRTWPCRHLFDAARVDAAV